MFSALVPNFLSGWELPSISAYASLSVALQRRVLSFLLRKIIGHLVKEGQLDWSQIEAGIVSGKLEIKDVELEPDVINAVLVDTPVYVTSARLGKISLQIPWSNFWSGHVIISIHEPQVHLAINSTQDRDSNSSTATLERSQNLAESLTDAAGSLLHEDPEGRNLEQTLQESLQLNEVTQPATDSLQSATDAGSIAASLVEGLLSRLKIQVTDAQCLLYASSTQRLPDLKLTVREILVETEAQQANLPSSSTIPEVREKIRSIVIHDVDVWCAQCAPDSDQSSSSSRSTSSDEESDDSNDLMQMSQAVGNLAESVLSTASRYEDAQGESMYASATGDSPSVRNEPPRPKASTSLPSSDFKRVLSIGNEPIELRFATRKPVVGDPNQPSPSRAGPSDIPDEDDEDGMPLHEGMAAKQACSSLRARIGTIVAFLDDDDACRMWDLIWRITVQQTPSPSNSPSSPAPNTSASSQNIDFLVEVAAVHLLVAYQSRQELPPDQCTAVDEALQHFWARPLRTHPPLGHLRLRLDTVAVNGHKTDEGNDFTISLSSVSLLEHLPTGEKSVGSYVPIVVFDEHLVADSKVSTAADERARKDAPDVRTASGTHSSTHHATDSLYDWRSEQAAAASSSSGAAWGPYQRTGFNDKAWKLRPRMHRRKSSSTASPRSKVQGADESNPAVKITSDGIAQRALQVAMMPLHIFADLSLGNRLIPFLHRLSKAHDVACSRHQDDATLAASIETLNGNETTNSPPDEPASRAGLSVQCPLVRVEARVPTTSDTLRSGIVALDLIDLTLRDGGDFPASSSPFTPRTARFNEGPIGGLNSSAQGLKLEISVLDAVLSFQPINSSRATRVAAVSRLGSDESGNAESAQEPPLKPRGAIFHPNITSAALLQIPLVKFFLTKPVLDGLQLLADDAGTWSRELSRVGETALDEQDGLRVLGSRFFGSRAGLSALSASESNSTTNETRGQTFAGGQTQPGRQEVAISSAITIEVTELAGELLIPHDAQKSDKDSATSDVQSSRGIDRLLRVQCEDLRTILNPGYATRTTSVQLSLMSLVVEESTDTEGDGAVTPLIGPTLAPSLARGSQPMLSLQMLLYADPESSYRESKIDPVLSGCTITITDDQELLSDIAHFAKAPEGAFENVEPNELTRLNVKVHNASVHIAPKIIEDRGVVLIGELNIKSRLVGDSPQTNFDMSLQDSFILLSDRPNVIASDKQRRIKSATDYWSSQGYAKALDLKDVRGGLTTSRFTLPEIEVRITRVRGHLEACADTLEVMGRLLTTIAPRKEREDDKDGHDRKADNQHETQDLTRSSAGSENTSASSASNLLGSVDEDAFRTAPTMESIPDMLEDDIPSRPDFFGQTEMRGEQSQRSKQACQQDREPQASDFEAVPLSEEDFFGQESVASLIQPGDTRGNAPVEGKRQGSNAKKILLQSDVVTVRLLDPRGVHPEIGYFNDPDLAPKQKSITSDFASSFRLRVDDCDLSLKLHAGYDWKVSRSEIEEEIKRVRKRLQKIKQLLAEGQKPDDSVEEAAQNLFESVHIAFDPETDATGALNALDDELGLQSETASSASTWQPLPRGQHGGQSQRGASSTGAFAASRKRTKLERSAHSQVDFVFKGIKVEFDSLVSDAPLNSHLGVTVRSVQILDNIKTSTWHAFLTEMISGDSRDPRHRRPGSNMVRIQLLNIRPKKKEDREELRVRAKVSPLRLHVDQDALDFLKKFFAFKRPSEAKKASERVPDSDSGSEGPFIQYAEVYPIKLKLDYKPKRVDYGLLRQGKTIEMMNFFHFDGAEMTLRHITLRGITGWPRLFDTLNDIWTPDVKTNQLADVLSGIAPIRSIVNVGSGFADLILLPIEQYQKDGRIAKGVRRGATRFAKVTALEALKLGARLATGTQAMLEKAEVVLGGPGSNDAGESSSSKRTMRRSDLDEEEDLSDLDRGSTPSATSLPLINEEEHRALISKYASQPDGISDGLTQAYKSLRGGMNSAAQTILAVPMEMYDGNNKVVKAVPVAVVQGARGASEAISKTLLGFKGVLEPQGGDQIEKYKRQQQ
ncbi:unnamed protein product [Sympodiomycopsis kandeliae]